MNYYRNVVTVEILSNEPWGDEACVLEVVDYETTHGNSMGNVTRTVVNQELTREAAVALNIAMGGDGTFITLGEKDELPPALVS